MPWEGPPDMPVADAKRLKCQQEKPLDGYPRCRPRRRQLMKHAGDLPSPLRNTAPADANRITNEHSRWPGLEDGDMADSIIRWPFLLPAFPKRPFMSGFVLCPATGVGLRRIKKASHLLYNQRRRSYPTALPGNRRFPTLDRSFITERDNPCNSSPNASFAWRTTRTSVSCSPPSCGGRATSP